MYIKKLLLLSIFIGLYSKNIEAAARCNISTATTASASTCSGLSSGDTIYITAVLSLTGDFTAFSGTDIVVVVDGASAKILWTAKADFKIGGGGKLILKNGGILDQSSSCNANLAFHVGTLKIADCVGSSSTLKFSDVNIAGGFDANGTLPVELINFSANTFNGTSQLKWATASEINNSHFNVERSVDGMNFEMIGTVIGNGNSQQIIEYAYSDNHLPRQSAVLFYRLNQFDFDGKNEYSNVIKVENLKELDGIKVFPNPTTGELLLNINQLETEEFVLELSNLAGKVVITKTYSELTNLVQLDIAEMEKGVYILKVSSDSFKKYFRIVKN